MRMSADQMQQGLKAPSLSLARKWLSQAIARHERHMDGSEATDDASQQTLMDEMRRALAALGE